MSVFTARIACIGECMLELQDAPNGMLRKSFGGDTLNTAVYLARIGNKHGLAVSYVTAFGDDPYSGKILEKWAKEGLDTSMVRRIPGKLPGIYSIRLDPSGDRSFHYWRGDSAARSCFEPGPESDALLTDLAKFSHVYLSGISLAILHAQGRDRLVARLAELKKNGSVIAFDFNFRPSLWPGAHGACGAVAARPWYKRLAGLADILLMTREEAYLTGCGQDNKDILAYYSGLRGQEVVIRDGSRPCLLIQDGKMQEIPAVQAERVLDTTAAGDSFSAAYLTGRCLGVPPVAATRQAHILAAAVVAHKGAIIPRSATPEFFVQKELLC